MLASANHHVLAGAYSVGGKLLGELDADQSAAGAASHERLAQSIEAKRVIVDDAAVKIQAAMDAGQHESAVALINGLQPDQRTHAKIAVLIQQAVGPLVTRGFSELRSGRLDRAAAIDDMLRPLQSASPSVGELQQCLTICRSAREHMQMHQYAQAEAQLAVLAQMVDGKTWIVAARSAIADAIRDLNSVSAGALGLLGDVLNQQRTSAVTASPAPPRTAGAKPFSREGLPIRSVLQVDGVGGLLLLSRDVITIGTSSSSSRLDVPLVTEGAAAFISIRRDGDDYFAESAEPFHVNGRPETRKLLTSGDSIAVGTRGRLRFLKPVAASGSAVLQITGSRLARRDIRSVVLMSDSLLFGPAGSHFRLSDAENPIVLHGGRDGYALRESVSRASTPQPAVRTAPAAINIGESVVMKDIRFVLMDG
ncbi:MAG: hypothetical protein GY903_28485 [Fuerstiella sp.]|nr:hypothetical protein [Fuerstiella sp.]MCP4858432.1 hypothetical protein [Fuerstiella sp.]